MWQRLHVPKIAHTFILFHVTFFYIFPKPQESSWTLAEIVLGDTPAAWDAAGFTVVLSSGASGAVSLGGGLVVRLTGEGTPVFMWIVLVTVLQEYCLVCTREDGCSHHQQHLLGGYALLRNLC